MKKGKRKGFECIKITIWSETLVGVCCSSESPASNCIWEGLAFRNLNIIRESEGKVGMFFLAIK